MMRLHLKVKAPDLADILRDELYQLQKELIGAGIGIEEYFTNDRITELVDAVIRRVIIGPR